MCLRLIRRSRRLTVALVGIAVAAVVPLPRLRLVGPARLEVLHVGFGE